MSEIEQGSIPLVFQHFTQNPEGSFLILLLLLLLLTILLFFAIWQEGEERRRGKKMGSEGV